MVRHVGDISSSAGLAPAGLEGVLLNEGLGSGPVSVLGEGGGASSAEAWSPLGISPTPESPPRAVHLPGENPPQPLLQHLGVDSPGLCSRRLCFFVLSVLSACHYECCSHKMKEALGLQKHVCSSPCCVLQFRATKEVLEVSFMNINVDFVRVI